ncbi:MAG: ABC transporter substrate-binding protein [Chloroflexota bacterium]
MAGYWQSFRRGLTTRGPLASIVRQRRLIVSALFAVVLVGCSRAAPAPQQPQSAGNIKMGGTLSFIQRADPTGWDIWGAQRTIDPTRSGADMVFSPLIIPSANVGGGCDFTFEGELAESWKYLDNKTIEVKLRPGVKWHNKPPINGRDLVADDVVYTLEERFKQGGAGATFLGRTVFDRAEAVDASTVKIFLKMPYANFLEDLYTTGWGWIVPRGYAGPDGKEWLEQPEKSWIGTGPFMFKEHQPGVKVVFEKNPAYFKSGKPYVDRVEMLIIADESTKLAQMRAGTVDLYPSSGPRSASDLKRTNENMFVKSCPSRFTESLNFPIDKAPFGDVRVRQAFSMAINRDALVKTVLNNQDAHVSVLWPNDPEALKLEDIPAETRKYLEYRPDEAKALLAQAGFPNGFATKIIFTQAYGSPWNELAEGIVTMLRGVGIQADMELMEYGAYIRQVIVNGEFDAPVLRYANRFSISDMAGGNLWSKHPAVDTTRLKKVPDTKFDAMIEEYWATFDVAKRKEQSKAMQLHIAETVPQIWNPTWGNALIAQPWVKNIGWRGNEKFFTNLLDQAWIDK